MLGLGTRNMERSHAMQRSGDLRMRRGRGARMLRHDAHMTRVAHRSITGSNICGARQQNVEVEVVLQQQQPHVGVGDGNSSVAGRGF